MERWREGFHQKRKIYQQYLFSWCIPGRLLKLLDVVWLSALCLTIFAFWQKKEKKAYNNHVKRRKYASIDSPRCPALWFLYIFTHVREE